MKFEPGDLVEATWFSANSWSVETGAAIVLETLSSLHIRVWDITLQAKRTVNKNYISSITMVRQEK